MFLKGREFCQNFPNLSVDLFFLFKNSFKILQYHCNFCRCEERTKPGCENPLTLPECAKIFKCLQDDFYEEYKMYDLASLSVALVFPMVCTIK